VCVLLVDTGSDQSQYIPRYLRSMSMFFRMKLALLNLYINEIPRTRYSSLSKRDQNTFRCRESAIPAGETDVAPPNPQGKMIASKGNETV
jgi:hypothetical protein